MAILVVREVADQRLAVGALFVGLSSGAAKSSSKVVQHEIRVLVGFQRHYRGGPTTHDATRYCHELGFRRASGELYLRLAEKSVGQSTLLMASPLTLARRCHRDGEAAFIFRFEQN